TGPEAAGARDACAEPPGKQATAPRAERPALAPRRRRPPRGARRGAAGRPPAPARRRSVKPLPATCCPPSPPTDPKKRPAAQPPLYQLPHRLPIADCGFGNGKGAL